MTFGENLKSAREAKGMTQQALAQQLYVTRQTVSRWENGTRYPDLYMTKRLAELFETSVDALLGGDTMNQYAEQQPVLESHREDRVQLCLFGAILSMCLPSLLTTLLTMTNDGFFVKEKLLNVPVWENLLLIALSVAGVVQSARQNMTPRWVGLIGAGYFFMDAAGRMLDTFRYIPAIGMSRTTVQTVAFAVLDLIFAALILCCFNLQKQRLFPAVSGLGTVMLISGVVSCGQWLSYFYQNYALLGAERIQLPVVSTLKRFLLIAGVCGMVLYQAVALHKKRKRTVAA